jgi:hypothetical protein
LDLRPKLRARIHSAGDLDQKLANSNCLGYNTLGLEAPPGFEPGMEVLQTSALPLGYGADLNWWGRARDAFREEELERETGFEPATSTLARSHSTTELFPLARATKV